jgi:hypothetical protein
VRPPEDEAANSPFEGGVWMMWKFIPKVMKRIYL